MAERPLMDADDLDTELDEDVTTAVRVGPSSRPAPPVVLATAEDCTSIRPLVRVAPARRKNELQVLQAAAVGSIVMAMGVTAAFASHVLERLSHRDVSAQILAVVFSTFVIALTAAAAVIATSIVQRIGG